MNDIPERMGHFLIRSKLGEGGMGIVYAGQDERLGRPAAIKVIRETVADAVARERFRREARTAATVNHPNICQLYEIDEHEGQLFIAMELLEGESLGARLESGPLPPQEAVSVALSLLAALETLHDNGIVHRDLKPSNVFLTEQGVKILDFGLARTLPGCDLATLSGDTLTLPGLIAGTPAYMAPERLLGHPIDERSDLFSMGVLVFEMLAGTTPFASQTVAEVVHAILHERPPVLAGSALTQALSRVIHRALEKDPLDRYDTASEMTDDLKSVMRLADSGPVATPHIVTRLIVLPFRMLQPDPDTEFLAMALPDAITSSLSGLGSLVVRSTLAAARFSREDPDLRAIAIEADVDAVLTGSLLRAGDEIRVSIQLVEAPVGTVVWSKTEQVALGGLFELQDDLSRNIVRSLSIPMTFREQQLLGRDVPANPRAYEYYLRGNQLSESRSSWLTARDLYLECVAEDSHYAPAWARLGRMHRLMAKWGAPAEAAANLERAREAFRRSLEINPDLAVAHGLYAYLEIDLGESEQAMLRLIKTAERHPAEPELFAGLVHACRYCGLLEASVAAHEQAQRLDPNARTSVCQTFAMMGDFGRALEAERSDEPMMWILARVREGREAEVVQELRRQDPQSLGHHLPGARALLSVLESRDSEFAAELETQATQIRDPEYLYYWALMAAYSGQVDRAVDILERAVELGFACYVTLVEEPWLESVRRESRFVGILADAKARQEKAAAAFLAAGGNRLLNVRLADGAHDRTPVDLV